MPCYYVYMNYPIFTLAPFPTSNPSAFLFPSIESGVALLCLCPSPPANAATIASGCPVDFRISSPHVACAIFPLYSAAFINTQSCNSSEYELRISSWQILHVFLVTPAGA